MRPSLAGAAGLVLAYALYGALDLVARPVYPVPEPGSVVLITGARRGIGFSAAKRLAKEGFYVFAGVRTEQDADEIDQLKLVNVDGIKLDMKSESDMVNVEQHIREFCAKHKKKFAGVIHNAVMYGYSFIELRDVAEVREIYEVGPIGSGLLTQKLLPLIREHHGRVVSVSSMGSYMAMAGGGAYSESKAASNMFMDTLRLEVFPHKVAVVTILSGMVASEVVTEGEALKYMANIYSKSGMKELYPSFHVQGDAMVAKLRDMTKLAQATTGWSSTDDSIVEAMMSPRPPLNLTPGTASTTLRFLSSVLPDAVYFRLLTVM